MDGVGTSAGVVRHSWPQKLGACLPEACRSLFWVPKSCLADTRSVAQTAAAGGSASQVKLQELEEPPRDPNTGQALYVAEIAPGKVIGDVSLVATADDIVAGDVQGLTGVKEPANHWRLQRWRYRPRVELSGRAAVLAAPAGANYYHWMLESLPRLQLLEWAGHEVSSLDWFLLNEEQHRFHAESLELLKIPAGKRHGCLRAKVYECERLVMPFMPNHRKAFPAWVGSFLRQRLLPAAAPMPGGQRLFISRRGANRRKLLNEAEIDTVLGRAGFKVVCLEDMSVAEQLGLFAAASIIVAIHGAALTNLVFAAPGTEVIELVAPTYINHCYQRVAQTMGLSYQEVVGQLKGKQRKRPEEDDLWIEPKALKQALEKAGA
jgi:capsular polysaccharide biosynthesis protein